MSASRFQFSFVFDVITLWSRRGCVSTIALFAYLVMRSLCRCDAVPLSAWKWLSFKRMTHAQPGLDCLCRLLVLFWSKLVG